MLKSKLDICFNFKVSINKYKNYHIPIPIHTSEELIINKKKTNKTLKTKFQVKKKHI